MIGDLKPFFHSHHDASGLDIYLFNKSNLVEQNPLVLRWVSNQCGLVQDRVWSKKFDTAHNSIDQDLLLFAWDPIGQSTAGFLSCAVQSNQNSTTYVYFSDAMILESYRKHGLLRYLIFTVNRTVKSFERPRSIVNIVISGCIHTFICFERSSYFLPIKWAESEGKLNEVYEFIEGDFGKAKIEPNGVVRVCMASPT